MNHLTNVAAGGFSFLPGGLAYSQGVVASPGFAIEHVRFRRPEPVDRGFRAIEEFILSKGRPLSALCAVELRSPKPLSIEGFRDFNRAYAEVLRGWGLVNGDLNAVARSNVAPIVDPPAEPSFFAFALTVPVKVNGAGRSFVVAGSSEWPEGGKFPEDVVRYGDTSDAAMHEKAAYVLAAMERRMAALGAGWLDATVTQSYSAYDVFGFLTEKVAHRCGSGGIVMHYCRPPVAGWDYEMDVKGVSRMEVLEV